MHPQTLADHARPDTAAALLRTVTLTHGDTITLVQHWAADQRAADGWARLEWITRTDATRATVHAPVTARYTPGQLHTCRTDWQTATDALTARQHTHGGTLTGDTNPLPPAPYAFAYDTPARNPQEHPAPRPARRRHAAPTRGPLTLADITNPAFAL